MRFALHAVCGWRETRVRSVTAGHSTPAPAWGRVRGGILADSARLVRDRPGPGGQKPDCERLSNAAGNEQWGRCNEEAGVTAGWTRMCASKRQMRNRPQRQRSDQVVSEISKSIGRSSS